MSIAVQPGDFCVVPVSGTLGMLISAGEWLNGEGWGRHDHAEIYLGTVPGTDSQYGCTASAYPDRDGIKTLACAPETVPGAVWSSGKIPLQSSQRDLIVTWCLQHRNIRYSWEDYFALVAHRMHIPAPGLTGFIAGAGSAICSQYVDLAYQAAGVHLFSDGRIPGYVTPAGLARLLAAA